MSASTGRWRLTRRLALDPDVPFLDDQPVRVEAYERDADEVLGTPADELRLSAPWNRRAITIDKGRPELALGRLLFDEHAGEVVGLGLAERMLLPERALRVKGG